MNGIFAVIVDGFDLDIWTCEIYYYCYMCHRAIWYRYDTHRGPAFTPCTALSHWTPSFIFIFDLASGVRDMRRKIISVCCMCACHFIHYMCIKWDANNSICFGIFWEGWRYSRHEHANALMPGVLALDKQIMHNIINIIIIHTLLLYTLFHGLILFMDRRCCAIGIVFSLYVFIFGLIQMSMKNDRKKVRKRKRGRENLTL